MSTQARLRRIAFRFARRAVVTAGVVAGLVATPSGTPTSSGSSTRAGRGTTFARCWADRWRITIHEALRVALAFAGERPTDREIFTGVLPLAAHAGDGALERAVAGDPFANDV
jgi:hypothetical protein